MQIKTSSELRKYLTENYYITIRRQRKTKQHIHNGNCTSLEIHKQLDVEFGHDKARKQYFVYDTIKKAFEKYFEDVEKEIAEKFPKKFNPYCHMCLTNQHKKWLEDLLE